MKKLLLSVITLFTIMSASAQNPLNGGMETWVAGPPGAPNDPTSWNSTNVLNNIFLPGNSTSVTQDMTAGNFVGGASGAQIVTVIITNNPDPTSIPSPQGLLFYGTVSTSPAGFKSGRPYTTRATCTTFNYKYTPVGGDSAVAVSYLTKWNTGTSTRDTVAVSYFPIGTTSTMMPASSPYWYTPMYLTAGTPDSLHIYLSSSIGSYLPINNPTPQVGSALWIDDVVVNTTWCAVGIKENGVSDAVKVYPNPAINVLNIAVGNEEVTKAEVFDVTGKKIGTFTFDSMKAKVNTDNLANGLYIYRLLNKSNEVINTGKFNVNK